MNKLIDTGLKIKDFGQNNFSELLKKLWDNKNLFNSFEKEWFDILNFLKKNAELTEESLGKIKEQFYAEKLGLDGEEFDFIDIESEEATYDSKVTSLLWYKEKDKGILAVFIKNILEINDIDDVDNIFQLLDKEAQNRKESGDFTEKEQLKFLEEYFNEKYKENAVCNVDFPDENEKELWKESLSEDECDEITDDIIPFYAKKILNSKKEFPAKIDEEIEKSLDDDWQSDLFVNLDEKNSKNFTNQLKTYKGKIIEVHKIGKFLNDLFYFLKEWKIPEDLKIEDIKKIDSFIQENIIKELDTDETLQNPGLPFGKKDDEVIYPYSDMKIRWLDKKQLFLIEEITQKTEELKKFQLQTILEMEKPTLLELFEEKLYDKPKDIIEKEEYLKNVVDWLLLELEKKQWEEAVDFKLDLDDVALDLDEWKTIDINKIKKIIQNIVSFLDKKD